MLGNRSISRIARAAIGPQHYRALFNMLRLYPKPVDMLSRYLLGQGSYPARVLVRTPHGRIAPMVYSHHDLLTVNEVFCRVDYPAGRQTRVVVDIGSNIGISALYFLTRNEHARVHLFEPVPANIARLRENLAGYEDRFTLDASAVASTGGRVTFGIEPTGRYGGIGVQTEQSIEVTCRNINTVLDQVLSHDSMIDILKIDTEGAEIETVRAIDTTLLNRVRNIYIEARPDETLLGQLFRQNQYGSVCQLRATR